MDTLHIHVASNIPDQGSEHEPICFGDLRPAKEHLRHRLQDQHDAYVERCEANTPEQRERSTACCDWCSAAWLVEEALRAVVDGEAACELTTRGICAWTFYPPEPPYTITYWAWLEPGAHNSCACPNTAADDAHQDTDKSKEN